MRKPNTLSLSAVSRGFNWWNPPGSFNLDCNEAANGDWPASGKLLVIDYIDIQHPIDLFCNYSALANVAAGAAARFTCTAMLYPTNMVNNNGPFGPPPISFCHTFTTPASGNFTIDAFTLAGGTPKKLTVGNWETVAGGTITVVDVSNSNVFVCNIVSFSAAGGAGGVSRFTVSLVSGLPSTVVTEASYLFDSATTNAKVTLAALGPIPYDGTNYYD